MTSNMELIGRDEINDLEAILSVCNSDVDSIVHAVKANADAVFTWDYERSRTPLIKLYEKAKTSGIGRFLEFGGSRHAND